MTTPQEPGLTAPQSERHIPLHTQDSSPITRQGHAQQVYTSHTTTYQYPNSNAIPNWESHQTSCYIHPWLDTIPISSSTATPSFSNQMTMPQSDVVTQQLQWQTLKSITLE